MFSELSGNIKKLTSSEGVLRLLSLSLKGGKEGCSTKKPGTWRDFH